MSRYTSNVDLREFLSVYHEDLVDTKIEERMRNTIYQSYYRWKNLTSSTGGSSQPPRVSTI